jgi:hypothetical protein
MASRLIERSWLIGATTRMVPRLGVQEGIDAVRRLFGQLLFDRRKCARLLQALGGAYPFPVIRATFRGPAPGLTR